MEFVLRLAGFSAATSGAGFLIGWTMQRVWQAVGKRRPPPNPSPAAAATPSEEPASRALRLFIGGLVVMLAGFGVTAWSLALTAYDEARETDGWPTAAGTITRLDLIENDEDTQMSMVGDVEATRIEVVLEYTYAVDGQTYTHNTIYLDEPLPTGRRVLAEEDARDLQRRYPVGKQVRVLYDPADPQRAALERDEDRGLFLVGLNAGIGFCLGAGAVTRWLMTR